MSARAQPSTHCPSLREALSAFLTVKSRSGLRRAYLTGLRQYLTKFIRRGEDEPICSVTAQHLDEWFRNRNEAPSAEASNRGRLSALFSFAVRRGWIERNPVDLLEPIRITRRPPEVLTVDECRVALEWTRDHDPQFLRLLVCMLLLGIRPHEVQRLTADAFRTNAVVVDAAASKIHRRRIVDVNPTAASWLACCGPWQPLSAATVRRWLRRLRDAIGRAAWPQDALRHTWISYSLAAGRSLAEVADQAGNSPGIIGRHYRALVTREDAASFWQLTPSISTAAK